MKIWSIGTAVRNPKRIEGFLEVLKLFDKKIWSKEAQIDYYIALIKFEKVHPKNISFEELENLPIFEARKRIKQVYEDVPLRGRVIGSLFKKLGFVEIDENNIISLTPKAYGLLEKRDEFRLVLEESLVGWEEHTKISQWHSKFNTLHADVNFSPFIMTLYMIRKIDKIEKNNEGISIQEYLYFIKVLDSYELMDLFSEKIIKARKDINYSREYIENMDLNIENLNDAEDYLDNDLKYFCETGCLKKAKNNRLIINYDKIGIIDLYLKQKLE